MREIQPCNQLSDLETPNPSNHLTLRRQRTDLTTDSLRENATSDPSPLKNAGASVDIASTVARHVPKPDGIADWAEHLRNASRSELKHWFAVSPAPALDRLEGEFDAELLDQGGPAVQKVTEFAFRSEGTWLGKAFVPVSERQGLGYNLFLQENQSIAKLPMDTSIEPSTIAEGESMFIRYHKRHSGLIRWLVGEVREVEPGVLLGMGLYGLHWNRSVSVRRKIPFLMVGPTRVCQFKVDHLNSGAQILSGKITLGDLA